MLLPVRQSKPELKIIKLKVTENADNTVEAFAEAHDMKKQGVASRIYERFGQLPEEVQKWFVGLTNGRESVGMREFAKMVLGEISQESAGKHEPVQGSVISHHGSKTVRNQGREERDQAVSGSRSMDHTRT